MKNVIEIKNLTKKYNELKAVDDLTFEVHEKYFRVISKKYWLDVTKERR